jgi:hypothetical protein
MLNGNTMYRLLLHWQFSALDGRTLLQVMDSFRFAGAKEETVNQTVRRFQLTPREALEHEYGRLRNMQALEETRNDPY